MPVLSARSKGRAVKSVQAMKNAAECIGDIEHGLSLFAVTRGQFSMIDCIRHVLDCMGPSRISVWTWCIADYELDTFEWLLHSGDISAATLVIDYTGERRVNKMSSVRTDGKNQANAQGILMARWKEKFGNDSIKVVCNHAKIATIQNDKFKVVVRGSMNLNFNPRFEQFDITEGDGPFDLVKEIENSLPTLNSDYTLRQVEDATGAHCLFTPEELAPFRTKGLKVWAK